MGARVVHYRDAVKKAILNIFNKEGINITQDNIKIWGCDVMLMSNVVLGANYVKSIGSDILIYTTKVPQIEYLERNERVTIYDEEKLQTLALKHKDYKLYDMLS